MKALSIIILQLLLHRLNAQPNLIVIMVDEQNFRTLGCYRDLLSKEQAFVWGDNVKVDTPNIDAVAASGALFNSFYANIPRCTPARASFFTGLHPEKTGAILNHDRLDDRVTTFAQVLKNEGYHTAFMGKWHLDGLNKPGWGSENGLRKFGFQENRFRFNQGHWKFLRRVKGVMKQYNFEDGMAKIPKKYRKNSYTTDFLFRAGRNFVNRATKKDKPFALILSIPDPHNPNIVRPPYDKMFNDLDFKLPLTSKAVIKNQPAAPEWLKNKKKTVEDLTIPLKKYLKTLEKGRKEIMKQYFGMVKLIDNHIEYTMKQLVEKGIDNDTVVVITSDHGDMLGEYGTIDKGVIYEASARVPMIIRYPGKVKSGKVIETTYSSMDFAPTILGLMGIDHTPYDFDGADASDILLDNRRVHSKSQTRIIFDPAQKPPTKGGLFIKWVAAVNNPYKLVMANNSIPYLFDLENDPNELKNFFGYPNYEEITEGLKHDIINNLPEDTQTGIFFWDNPGCVDSRNSLFKLGYALGTSCASIGGKIPISDCVKNPQLSKTCEVSCGQCCQNSPGSLLIDGKLRKCSQLQGSHCHYSHVQTFCPENCNLCKV